MILNLERLDNYLLKKDLDPIFLLIGDDFGQISYITDRILEKYFKEEQCYIDVLHYSDLQKDFSLLKSNLQSLQLFTKKKAIIIKDLQGSLKKEILQLMKCEYNDCLLILQGENLKKSSETYKELECINKICFINCYKLDINSTAIFIDRFLKSHGVKYVEGVPKVIASYLPANILLVKNELEKLIQYLGEDELNINIIEGVISGEKDFTYMDLYEAMVFKEKSKMIKQLVRIDMECINFISIIRVLQNYFVRVLKIKKEEKFDNNSVYNIVNNLNPPVFFKQKGTLLSICNAISYDESINLVDELIQLEMDCKLTFLSSKMLLYNYLIRKVQ